MQRRLRGEVLADRFSRAMYATDASVYQILPAAVVRPRNAADVVQTVRFCRDNGDRLKSLRVWDRGGDLPLVVQPEIEGDLGFELGAHVSKQLRALWQ